MNRAVSSVVLLSYFLFCWQAAACARIIEMPLRDKVARSAVIATVRVRELVGTNPPGRYRRSARVEVVQAVKGASTGQELLIDYDSGHSCDDVTYSAGEEAFVFLAKQPNGRLSTCNWGYGKYSVDESTTRRWTVKRYLHRDAPLKDALRMIREALAGKKTPA